MNSPWAWDTRPSMEGSGGSAVTSNKCPAPWHLLPTPALDPTPDPDPTPAYSCLLLLLILILILLVLVLDQKHEEDEDEDEKTLRRYFNKYSRTNCTVA
ncbi:MAG: hypothetical protein ABI883_09165 [Chthoniobacterales bacterium]